MYWVYIEQTSLTEQHLVLQYLLLYKNLAHGLLAVPVSVTSLLSQTALTNFICFNV